jgi:hypothetical protein
MGEIAPIVVNGGVNDRPDMIAFIRAIGAEAPPATVSRRLRRAQSRRS